MTTDKKTLAVDVLEVLRIQLSWIGPCRPDDDEIDCERWDRIEDAIAAVAKLIDCCESLQQHPDDLKIQADFCRSLAHVKGESA